MILSEDDEYIYPDELFISCKPPYPEDKWREYSYAFQITNIGTELGRAIEQKKDNTHPMNNSALAEVIWQLEYTLRDPKNKDKLKELNKAKANVYKYFSSSWYWYLEKRIIRFFDSYLYEYAEEASTKKEE